MRGRRAARRPGPSATRIALAALAAALATAFATAGTAAAEAMPAAGPASTTRTAPPVTRPQRVMSIGFLAGEPSGATFRMISPAHATHAWEMGLGWSMAGEDGLQFHAQHQWHLATLTRSSRGATTFYVGAGGRVKQVEGTRIGVRAAAGIHYLAGTRPRSWEAFFEVAPIVDLTPDNDTSLNAAFGVRWYVPGGTGR